MKMHKMPNYSTTDIEVLYANTHSGFRFSNEFRAFLKERGISDTRDMPLYARRTNVDLIAAVREFGLDRVGAPGCKIHIQAVPAFRDWYIDEYDSRESVVCSIPWEAIARAFMADNKTDPILIAIAEGKLVVPAQTQ